RGLHLRMAKQFADHGQPLPDQKAAGRKSVAEIMDANVVKFRSFADASPRVLQIGEMRLLFLSHDYVGITLYAWQFLQQAYDRAAKMNRLCTGLAIGKSKLTAF